MKKKKLNASDVIRLLAKRYDHEAWVFLEQVANATGSDATRTADAIAMGLWPSRGLDILGFEVKVSRSDWIKELKDPSKADKIQRYCDFWWVVVGDASIIHDGEMPLNWGLLAPTRGNTTLKVIKSSPRLKPKKISKKFLASILRNLDRQQSHRSALKKATKSAFDEGKRVGFKEGTKFKGRDSENLNKALLQLQQRIQDFEKASGVSISEWEDPLKIGRAVNFVLRLDSSNLSQFIHLRDRLKHKVDMVDGAIEDWEKIIKVMSKLVKKK